jgi:site-specific DNA-methyltransferase (adenine-specific)
LKGEIGTIKNVDCMEHMKHVNSGSVDLIIADPPYFEICGEFDYKYDSEEEYLEWIKDCIIEFNRILNQTGTLILWSGVGCKKIMMAKIAVMIENMGLFKIKNWVTQRNTRGIGTKRNYMSAREDFLFLTKTDDYTFNVPYTEEKSNRKDLGANGKPRKNTYKRVSNVWTDITEASQSSKERFKLSDGTSFPTVKAQKLCDRIILTHSNENDLVYIPFAGSGSEIVSCERNNRKWLASEINSRYIDEIIQKRLADLNI